MGIVNQPEKKKNRKNYDRPLGRKITSEDAKRKLIEHASRGSQDGKEGLEMILADEAKKVPSRTTKSVTATERNCSSKAVKFPQFFPGVALREDDHRSADGSPTRWAFLPV